MLEILSTHDLLLGTSQKSSGLRCPPPSQMRESWNSTLISHNTIVNDHVPYDVEMGNRASTPLRCPCVAFCSHHFSQSRQFPLRERILGLQGMLMRIAPTSEVQGTNTDALDAIPVPKPAFMGDSKTIPGAPASTSPAPISSTTVMSDQQQQQPHPSSNIDSRLKLKKPKPLSPSEIPVSTKREQKWMERERVLQSLNITRRPPTTAVLQPVHQYCNTNEISKPY